MQLGIWALGVVSIALQGTATRPADFGTALDIAPHLLIPSLDDLVTAGLMELRASGQDRRYLLTEHGRDLHDTVTALGLWNDRWLNPEADVALPPDVEQIVAVPPGSIEITVLGGFSITVDGKLVAGLSSGSQRLLIFLALNDRKVTRLALANAMWPNVPTRKSSVSLRSAIARLDPQTRACIVAVSATLAFTESVTIDLMEGRALAHRLINGAGEDDDLSSAAITTLSTPVLPDWYEDWILDEDNEWRILRLSALESLSLRLMESGRWAEAKRAAGMASRIDPLRESPRSALIRIHLAEGNQSEALAVYDHYTLELRESLDLSPTDQLSDLVAHIHH